MVNTVTDTVTDTPTGVLICPVCQKTRVFSIGAKGKISSHCAKCGRTIVSVKPIGGLW